MAPAECPTMPPAPLGLVHREGRVRLAILERPRREAPDVVLAVRLVGVCSSDLKEIRGEREGRRDFGHELVGVVRHSAIPVIPTDERVVLDPHVGVSRTGGFADAVHLYGDEPSLRAALRPVPTALDDEAAIFVEPLACVTHALARLRRPCPPNGRVAVVGAGTAGVLFAARLHQAGCRVSLLNAGSGRLRHLTLHARLPPSIELRSLTQPANERHDAVVVATTTITAETLEWAAQNVAHRGTVLLYGGTSREILRLGDSIDLDDVRRSEGEVYHRYAAKTIRLLGSHGADTDDFHTAAQALAGSELLRAVCRSLIDRRLPLVKAAGPLTEMAWQGRRFGKTVVLPSWRGVAS